MTTGIRANPYVDGHTVYQIPNGRTMLVFDERLDGPSVRGRRRRPTPPTRFAANVMTVNETFRLYDTLHWVHDHAVEVGGLTDLVIMCHGRYFNGVLTPENAGEGLVLCREELNMDTVSMARMLLKLDDRGRPSGGWVERITLFACGAAGYEPLRPGTRHHPEGRGRRLCMALARHTNATVYAASQVQLYNNGRDYFPSVSDGTVTIDAQGDVEFGDWEGPVYAFPPTGDPRRVQG